MLFEKLEHRTKPASHRRGRRLYTLKKNNQNYWLKLQIVNSEPAAMSGFLNELDFYMQQKQSVHFLLPVDFIELQTINNELLYTKGIILPQASDFFRKYPVKDLNHKALINQIERILLTLQLLHLSGWIHGDLKSEHWVEYQDELCLIDFEYSQKLENSKPTETHATPHYMAPELFHGKEKSIQSDLYALGIILYEWLTQKKLVATTYQEWALLHCQQFKIELPNALNLFKVLLEGLLQKHQYKRFANAEQALIVLKSMKL